MMLLLLLLLLLLRLLLFFVFCGCCTRLAQRGCAAKLKLFAQRGCGRDLWLRRESQSGSRGLSLMRGLQRFIDAFKVLGVLEGALLVVKIGFVRNDLRGGRG